MANRIAVLSDFTRTLFLLNRFQFGHRFWLLPLLVLVWQVILAAILLLGWRDGSFQVSNVQHTLIGFPLYLIAIGIGVRIIAGEIEKRTLEVTYMIPGSARAVCTTKIIAAVLLLLLAESVLAITTVIFFTSYPLIILYGSFQGAVFYLVLAMALGAICKSELIAGVISVGILIANINITSSRWTPLFNSLSIAEINQGQVLIWTIQNFFGSACLIVGIIALSYLRVEDRESLLS